MVECGGPATRHSGDAIVTLMTWILGVDAKLDEIIDRLNEREDDDDT